MPWSGGSFTRTNGVNTGATLWAQDRDDGTKILATRHDTNDQDMADGINSTLEKSGSNAATGNLNIGSNRLTAVADGTAKTDAATVNQIQSNGPAFQATDTGTANAYVIALSPAITAYAAGQEITFKAGAASTTASTLNVNTLGTKALKKLHDQDIEAGDIESGSIVTAVYDGTNFQVTSQLASAGGGTPGGSNTQVQYNSSDTFAGDADLTFDGTELTAAGVNLAAFSGVLEANANFVDQVIFGPSVDGMAWSGLWSKASVFSSLMLATVEDAGADSQINIWDLTTKANTTPLGTVTLSGDATPTSIAAAMGYIIVGSEDGISIIDPHSGAWAERTTGWPKTLSSSTAPALTNNSVVDVAAALSNQPAYDPRTGGPMPTFGVAYDVGADIGSLLKDDGNVYDRSGTVTSNQGAVVITNGKIGLRHDSSGGRLDLSQTVIENITADDWSVGDVGGTTTGEVPGLGFDDAASGQGNLIVGGSDAGLTFISGIKQAVGNRANQGGSSVKITRAYNSGHMITFSKGAWLANSKTVDRSVQANTLTENGSLTLAAAETSSEIQAVSGFSSSNYLSLAYNADFDFGTGDFSVMGWFKLPASTTYETLFDRGDPSPAQRWLLRVIDDGRIEWYVTDGSNDIDFYSETGTVYDDGVWHHVVATFDGTTKTGRIYADGVQVGESTDASIGSLSDTSAIIRIGQMVNATTYPFNGSMALWRVSGSTGSGYGSYPDATQVREIYDSEKGLFVASAECLLQSGSTDAVLDVDVDPLTNKVLVTQTDAITVFSGLVVDSKPTVNSGTSEKGKLWGDLRSEQNSANAYVTAPATDQRQVNEMVRGLANDMPGGPDLSKAKAWLKMNGTGTISISASYNIKSITDNGTGNYEVVFSTPFKSNDYVMVGSTIELGIVTVNAESTSLPGQVRIKTFTASSGAALDAEPIMVAFFGELENE